MLKKIVIVLVVVLAAAAGIGMLLPRKVHVERSIVVQAPRATVFALVDGFHAFNRWSPWHHRDPNATYTFSGPDWGAGAKMSWAGDPKTVGSGTEEVLESKPPESVSNRIDFGKQGIALARFTFVPDGDGTKVTWGLDSDMGAGPIGRYFGLMMDRMIGPDFDEGLANLKKLAESLPKTDFADLAVERIDASPVTVAFMEAHASHDPKEIGAAIGAAYMKIGVFVKANGLKQAGAPITIDTKWDDSGYDFEAAIPVDRPPEKAIPPDSPVRIKQTYGGPALKAVHKGSYATMPSTFAKLAAVVAVRGYEPAGAPWDEYVSDPGTTPEPELVTNVVQPIKPKAD